ncbi:hypothetical protein [Paraliomyxa miuraensis]|uniref:hypothetical protein n=1 Tax=Paraliomyxa miuraensis TaxID=376150 RepID=UPI002259561C|nr:hypothetical protein [Paraliomyxa miuraensis]MCX4247111.1 hypothetical protein [Paraliomyxa miuraensis]
MDDGSHDVGVLDDVSEFRSGGGGVLVPPTGPKDGYIGNGIEYPEVGGIDPAHALSTPEGMSESGELLDDPDNHDTAQYLVECALPQGASIEKVVGGQTLVFNGALGLAPQWQYGACDVACQEWVSACLLARTNESGETVGIWMRGDHPALGAAVPEDTVLEAGFWGNLFVDSDEVFYCKGSGKGVVAAKREGRTCSGGACGFTKYPKCTHQSRCEFVGPDADVPSDCKSGQHGDSAPYRTIATYVPDP